MAYGYATFENTVVGDFDRRRRFSVMEHKDSLTASAYLPQTRALGHPMFEPLRVGEKAFAPIATVFLDLSNFTGRTFWDDPDQVADLAHAILTGFIEVVSGVRRLPARPSWRRAVRRVRPRRPRD